MANQSVNWLVKRVECDIRNFYDHEAALRDESLRAQEALRQELKSMEDRTLRAEMELEARAARQRELEGEMERRVKQLNDRILQLETAAAEDGKVLVDMRDTERTLRSEADQLVNRLRGAEEELIQNERIIGDFQEKLRQADDRAVADDRHIVELRESLSKLQGENEHIAHSNAMLEERLEQALMKVKLAEEQAASDERSINELRDALGKTQIEHEQMLQVNLALEERNAINEQKLRRLLDEVGEEVGKMKYEVDRQRRDLDVNGDAYPAHGTRMISVSHSGGNTSIGHSRTTSPNRSSIYSPSRSGLRSNRTLSPRREVSMTVRGGHADLSSSRVESSAGGLRVSTTTR